MVIADKPYPSAQSSVIFKPLFTNICRYLKITRKLKKTSNVKNRKRKPIGLEHPVSSPGVRNLEIATQC